MKNAIHTTNVALAKHLTHPYDRSPTRIAGQMNLLGHRTRRGGFIGPPSVLGWQRAEPAFRGPPATVGGGQAYRCHDAYGQLRFLGAAEDARKRVLDGNYYRNVLAIRDWDAWMNDRALLQRDWYAWVTTVVVHDHPTMEAAREAVLGAWDRAREPVSTLVDLEEAYDFEAHNETFQPFYPGAHR